MEKLVTAFLYKYKFCPLSLVGSLVVQPGHAEYMPGEARILAPYPFIELNDKEITPNGFIEFIADQKGIDYYEATSLLYKFCEQLRSLQPGEEFFLGSAGSFYKSENETIHFKNMPLQKSFFPDVPAERVVHPDASHHMLVGDTETNSAAMTEILKVDTVERKKWRIAAIVFALLAVVMLLINYANNNLGSFGNSIPVKPNQESKTYTIPEK